MLGLFGQVQRVLLRKTAKLDHVGDVGSILKTITAILLPLAELVTSFQEVADQVLAVDVVLHA
jgi:hypothetical protein